MSYKVVKNWRKKHVQEGLCLDCVEKAEEGHKRCRTHLDAQAEKVRQRRGSSIYNVSHKLPDEDRAKM